MGALLHRLLHSIPLNYPIMPFALVSYEVERFILLYPPVVLKTGNTTV